MARYAAVPAPFNTRIIETGIGLDDILALDPGLVARFVALCGLYGYPTESRPEGANPALVGGAGI